MMSKGGAKHGSGAFGIWQLIIKSPILSGLPDEIHRAENANDEDEDEDDIMSYTPEQQTLLRLKLPGRQQ